MSKFLDGGREGHGRERQADFAYAGGMTGPAAMTPIERLLVNNGIKGPDAKETAEVIMSGIEAQVKDGAPFSKKVGLVNMMIAPLMRGAESGAVIQLVNKTLDMAEDQVARKIAATAPAAPKQTAATPPKQTVATQKMGR